MCSLHAVLAGLSLRALLHAVLLVLRLLCQMGMGGAQQPARARTMLLPVCTQRRRRGRRLSGPPSAGSGRRTRRLCGPICKRSWSAPRARLSTCRRSCQGTRPLLAAPAAQHVAAANRRRLPEGQLLQRKMFPDAMYQCYASSFHWLPPLPLMLPPLRSPAMSATNAQVQAVT